MVFAADHGIAVRAVSAWPVAETARRATLLALGGGPIGALAASAGVGIRVIDVGVDGDLSASGVDVSQGSGAAAA